jgi:hypothetical protein
LPGVSLRQREWDHADGQKQKHVKGTPNKMSFDGGIDLLFHFGVVLVRILILSVAQTTFWGQDTLFTQKRKRMSILFLNNFLTRIQATPRLRWENRINRRKRRQRRAGF